MAEVALVAEVALAVAPEAAALLHLLPNYISRNMLT